MKINCSNPKLLVSFTLPVLLFGCAQQPPLIYQQPAPVYRPKQAPLAKPEPAPKPKPKPKIETFKLPSAPIVSEDLNVTKEPEPAPQPVPSAPAPAEPVTALEPKPEPEKPTEQNADRAGYSAPSVAVSGSPAVLALMQDADRTSSSGNLDAAAATVERALRIDSRNPALLYKLAQLRLKQNQPRLAEDLAKKSELYAGNNRELKKNSWLLIAKARYMQGDKQGADEARAKASRF